jgi:hypothetical protein
MLTHSYRTAHSKLVQVRQGYAISLRREMMVDVLNKEEKWKTA